MYVMISQSAISLLEAAYFRRPLLDIAFKCTSPQEQCLSKAVFKVTDDSLAIS